MGVVVNAEEMEKRRMIHLARSCSTWANVVASMAISGFTNTEANDVMAGRLISGKATFEQIISEIKQKYKVDS